MNYLLAIVVAVLLIWGGYVLLKGENYNPVGDNYTTDDSSNQGSDGLDQSRGNGNTLDLSGQNLSQVPMSVFSDTGLVVLNLSNNNLTGALPAEVRHLSKLQELDLSDNDFTGVPAEVGQLSELQILNLSNNPITGLPHEISNLKNLQVLDLRGTNYSHTDLEVIKGGLSSEVNILTDD